MNTFNNLFSPLLITQIRENQNVFLISPNELNKCQQDFSNHLYKYIDVMPPKSCYRIFKYKNKIYLVYYWLSNMREQRSNRDGLYLIIGMSCNVNVFKKFFFELSQSYIRFYEIIQDVFNIENNDSTVALKSLWNDCEFYTQKTMDAWKMYSNKFLLNKKQVFAKCKFRKKYNIFYMLSSIALKEYISIFVCIVAKNVSAFHKIDYSDLQGYGQYNIKILRNGDEIPSDIKKTHVNSIVINDNTLNMIEML